MSADTIMRNLAALNTLWDGGTVRVKRATSDPYTVEGARVSVSVQIQPAAFRSFLDKHGDLARGSGFLPRFLIAHPETTQGTRKYRAPPASWPALERFHATLRAVLDQGVTFDEAGRMAPAEMQLADDARTVWINFHDQIEAQLADGGALRDVRDVASKIADNAARIAALLTYGDRRCAADPIEEETMRGACRIAEWHLHESQRYFGEIAVPDDQARAGLLDAWLIDRCRLEGVAEIDRSVILRTCPNAVRKLGKAGVDEALELLEVAYRVRVVKLGRKAVVRVNPKLLAEIPS